MDQQLITEQHPTVTIIMYHYVRDTEKTEYPKIHAVSVKQFQEQINTLRKLGYEFINLDQYHNYLTKGVPIPQKSCILTFDDGFKDHYTNVFPVLKKEGISGVFYPVTQPLVENTVPVVQKIHFILAKIEAEQFAEEINMFLKKYPSLFKEYEVHDRFKINPQKRFDANLTANLKHNLARMTPAMKEEIVNKIFARHFDNEEKFCKELYASFDELKEMIQEGMLIGSQTHTHPLLSALSYDKQEREIIQGHSILEKELGIRIKHFTYPYGGYTRDTMKILMDYEYHTATTIKLGTNTWPVNPFGLRRINCNDIEKLAEKEKQKQQEQQVTEQPLQSKDRIS